MIQKTFNLLSRVRLPDSSLKSVALPNSVANYYMNCRYCNKECKNDNSLRNHERLCKSNPNRQLTYFSNHQDFKRSNQFIKAKELGLPVPEVSNETRRKQGEYWLGKHLSEETKKKQSNTMKKKIMEGTIEVGYLRYHSSKVSYPEEYFMEVFKGIPYKYNYQVGLYQLDFAIPERKVYIEIDGEQHYTDKRIVEYDKERTSKLESLGWKCIKRVRWSKYQKLSEEEKSKYCEQLKEEFLGHW